MTHIEPYQIESEETSKGALFVAWFPSMPGLRAQAANADQAIVSLYELLPRYEASMAAIGSPVAPSRTILVGEPKTEYATGGSTSTWSPTLVPALR